MATGKDAKYSRCSLCLDDGRNTVARHYCVDCETYFCTGCVKCHKLPSLKTHQVNDIDNTDVIDMDDTSGLQSDVPSESVTNRRRCTFHEDKLIDTYCKDHDEVCCGTCTVFKHRSCTTVSIAIAAKDFKSSPDMNKFKEALTVNLGQCKREKEKRTDNLKCIDKQKLELIENVDKYEERIIAKIKELANISRNEIRSKYEEHKTVLDTDIGVLDVVIASNTEYVDKLRQTDDEHIFVFVKTSKTVTKDGEILLQAMTKDWKKKGIQFCLDQALEKHVLEMKSLGQLDEHVDTEYNQDCVTKYQATFQSNVNIKQRQDRGVTVVDMCFIDQNDLLIAENGKRKLKRFNSMLQFKDEIALSGSPVAVCKTDKHEVAVRIQSTKVVQFVSVGQSLQPTSSFTLNADGWGMTYDAGAGEIFACEENKVSVYSKTGNKLRTYDKDSNGEQMFSACRQIAVNKQDIYVTDVNKGLIVLDKSGTLKMKGVSNAWLLCLLPGDICLAGDFTSGVIVQVDKDGKQVENLVDSKDGRQYTYCAVYDREHSRLIVGGCPNGMAVYTLSENY